MSPRRPGSPVRTTRRGFLAAGMLAAGGAAAVAWRDRAATGDDRPPVPLGSQPPGLPRRQHAWTHTLATDTDGNPVAPRHAKLLFFDIPGRASVDDARRLEAALRTLERRYPWGPDGLLFTAGWGPDYFESRLAIDSPVPKAKALSDFELPTIDTYDFCLHLACNNEQRLNEVEAELLENASSGRPDGRLAVPRALRWRETRTGFVGSGLPAAHQDVAGIPADRPVPARAPLYMGFKSNLRKNQATEDAVTITEAPFIDATTMQVSYMRLRLDSWYRDLSETERVARMYAPQVTPDRVAGFTTDAPSDPRLIEQSINRYGVIGHSQSSARARRHNRPLILRRDFNTTDADQAGLHFVSLQRTIEDFIATRNAMNASSAQLQNPAITDTVNNGINEFMLVLRRANYLIPARDQRSFPLLARQTTAV